MSSRTAILKWSLVVLAVLACLVGFGVLLLMTYDWNHARPWINRKVTDAIGRPFAINGDLAVEWKHAPAGMHGWRAWVPWPHVTANDITVANPDWVEGTPQMVKVKQVAASVAPLPLLHHVAEIPELRIELPRVHLQRDKEGRNNWTFKQEKEDKPSSWVVQLDRLAVNKGTLRVVDGVRKADVRATIDSPGTQEQGQYGVTWTLAGTVNGDAVTGDGRAGRILSLREANADFPVEASLRVGKTVFSATGILTNPRKLAALDLKMKMSGASLAQLYPLTGITLPETPPYSTEGHLVGTLNRQGGDWRYEDFKGKVGSSDIGGTIEFVQRESRPLLKGKVVSNTLNFDDLAPLIGADSNPNKVRRGQAPVQPHDKALPVEKFKTDRLKSIDADVEFSGRRIVRQKQLPIDNLVTHVELKDGVLALAPLNFGVAGGTLKSDITLDSRDGDKLKAKLKLQARHFHLKDLLPKLPDSQASIGEINGEAALTATGNSVAELLGSSNGEVRTLVDRGTVSKFLLEAMGLNVGNIIVTKLFGDKQVTINCLAGDFKVTNGVLDTRTFVMDTEDASLYVDGKVDLNREKLDLTLHPDTKSPRIVTLRSPIYIGGTFKKPDVQLDKPTLLAKAGGAIALGIAAPAAAALLPLVNLGKDKQNPCGALLAQVRKKPEAPPPGKTANR